MAGMTSNIDRWKKTRNTTDTTGVLSDDIDENEDHHGHDGSIV